MRGSLLGRVGRLSLDLVSSPSELVRYCRYGNFFHFHQPIDLRLPWIAFRAIDVVEIFIKPGCRVLEWGSGGSTLYFADRGCQVLSIEHDPIWATRVRERLSDEQRRRVEIQVHDIEAALSDYEVSSYVRSPLGRTFDLVLVDGFTDYHGTHRNICFELAENIVNPDALIVIDDDWMFPSPNHSNADWERTLSGVGPGRCGVTSSRVYAYGAWANVMRSK